MYRKSTSLSKRNETSLNTNLTNDQISHSNNNTSEVIYEEIQDIKPDDYHLTTCPAYGISSKK